MSPFTAQKLFKQTMGVTPAQYQRALRAHSLRASLRPELDTTQTSVTDAIYEAGYSSSSRAYENSPLGMTPTRFQSGGRGETIRYATAPCSDAAARNLAEDWILDGWILVAATDRGICWLSLADTPAQLRASLQAEFPAATLTEDPALAETVTAVLKHLANPSPTTAAPNLPLDLRGTAFQLRVWQALQQIPRGQTLSYSQLAASLGNPNATRAVARACATNRVAVLVPCHRVVGASGSLTGYRWGLERKRQLLASEKSPEIEKPRAASE